MRDATPMTGGRSPIKANAFHRYTGNRKKKWCPNDGRALVYFKNAECWSCTECGHTEYIVEQKQQPEQQGIGGVMSVDGLSDVRSSPNRAATKFRSKDPRARFLKPKSEIDDELIMMAEAGGWTIKRYDQRIEQSGEVLSQEELRANK